jgi:hypothetical protein
MCRRMLSDESLIKRGEGGMGRRSERMYKGGLGELNNYDMIWCGAVQCGVVW